jgi:hypothetical protein
MVPKMLKTLLAQQVIVKVATAIFSEGLTG